MQIDYFWQNYDTYKLVLLCFWRGKNDTEFYSVGKKYLSKLEIHLKRSSPQFDI